MTEHRSWPRAEFDSKVLKAGGAGRLRSLEQFAAAVDTHARGIVEDAERVRAMRWKEGYEAGLAEGRAVMLRELLAQREAGIAMVRELEDRAVELVLAATRRIVGELDESEIIARMVDLSLAELRPFRNFEIAVPAGLTRRLTTPLRQLVARRLPGAEVEIIGDEGLEDASCRIATEGGFLHLSIEELLGTLANEIDQRMNIHTADMDP
ncbi:MAG: hypothetical protein R3C97_08495 [Geminicoccaceae bacterium]